MKKKIIIFDLDGTLANIDHRRHFVTDPKSDCGILITNIFDPGIPHAKVYCTSLEECLNAQKEFNAKGPEKFYADRKAAEWKPDWKAFYEACVDDTVNEAVMNVMQWMMCAESQGSSFTRHIDFTIWSGREQSVEEQTRSWLRRHSIDFDKLRMRPVGDYTPDEELKEKWLLEVGVENVLMVFDDRDKVVKMWRRHGVPCFQVAEGNF